MNESRTQKAAKNITYNLVNQMTTLILAFVARIVFLKYLGAEYLGLNALFTEVLSFLSIADLGIGTAMVYSFYKPLSNNDLQKLGALVAYYKKIYRAIAVIVAILGIAIIPLLPHIVKTDSDIPHIYFYYLICLSNNVISYLFVYKTSILTADQKNYYITRITLIINIICVIMQIVVIIMLRSFSLYLLLKTISTLMVNILSSKKVKMLYPIIQENNQLAQEEKKSIFITIQSVFIYNICSSLLNATDNMLISVIVGTLAVGYYSNYMMITTKILQFVGIFYKSITASIGNLIEKEDAERKYEVFECAQTIAYFICCIIIPGYILLVNDFVKLWIGEKYLFSVPVTVAIVINLYLQCIYQPIWSYREATGLYKKTKWIMLSCGILNIILSIIGGYIYGVFGIVLASSISRIVTYVWSEPKILFREYFERSAAKFFVSMIKNIMIVCSICIVAHIISRYLIPDVTNWLIWILKGMLVGLLSIVCAWIAYRETEGFKMMKGRLKLLWKR